MNPVKALQRRIPNVLSPMDILKLIIYTRPNHSIALTLMELVDSNGIQCLQPTLINSYFTGNDYNLFDMLYQDTKQTDLM